MKPKSLPIAIAATLVLSASALAEGGKYSRGASAEDRQSQHGAYSHRVDIDTVREVQRALQSKGHETGPIDGVFGPQTASALRAFQRAQGLNESGEMDAQTLASLGVDDSVRTHAGA